MPHSDIHGSTPARGSPWLFAACHVLHRLLVPRHPPNALLSLEIATHLSTCHPPCTETILSVRRPKGGHQPQGVPAHRRSLLLSTQQSSSERLPCSLEAAQTKDSTSGQTCEQVRPETHQNLIHPDKDLSSGLTRGPASPPETPTASRFLPESPRGVTINADHFRFSAIPSEHLAARPSKPGSWWR